MDGCVETALLRKACLRPERMLLSSYPSPYHFLQQSFPPVEEALFAPLDRAGLLAGGDDFSVDDLLDLGGPEDDSAAAITMGTREPEEEEEAEEEGEGEREEERDEDDSNNSNSSPSSALSFQALPPSDETPDPAGGIEDLEWVSHFIDDYLPEFPSTISPIPPPPPAPKSAAAAAAAVPSLKRTWGSCCFSTDSITVPAKARSKRSRTGGRVWSLCRPLRLADSSSSSSSSCSSASSSSSCSSPPSSLSSCLIYEDLAFLDQLPPPPPLPQQGKKKGRKPKAVAAALAAATGDLQAVARRRCSHCGVEKTPQWRAGPMGAKTLCNACGVRYKSGRLLPEYRPAGSPTFLSHVHSNSHRKVLEMRRKKELICTVAPLPAIAAAQHGFV